ncbi:hypothetical protein GCM10027586_20710 [Kineococcus gypseus]|uniref:LGFP repeat-containing protein n=1 Tax=Kineococcus gypseus TaxID=1637102 RepID=UPI003D7DC64D
MPTATAAPLEPVVGEIGVRHAALGGSAGLLGAPLTPELRTPNGRGAYVLFERGAIYWTPWTGAHEVHGEIRAGYGRLGWENGLLGFPTSDEQRSTTGRGAVQDFEGGRVYWTPWTGAHEVHGAILTGYRAAGEEASPLGFPTSSELRTPNGQGAYARFEGGTFYFSPASGAHPVRGDIAGAYAAQGWENGCLGFPIRPERQYEAGPWHVQEFQGGWVWWAAGFGTQVQLYPRDDPAYTTYGLYPRC